MAKKKTTRPEVDWQALREAVRNTDREVLGKVIRRLDGHTVFRAEEFADSGLPPGLVPSLTYEHRSSYIGDPKYTVYDPLGRPLPALTGLYGLDLLEFIAGCFGVRSNKMGRGFRAGDMAQQLLELWQQEKS